MARKSRKENSTVIIPEADHTYHAAMYIRLSVEDAHTGTASIETQQLIIERYLERFPEITVCQTYIDNGATGTNFHRAGFQQMLADIEDGHINCVIVKDLSRLGRNAIDTGFYIERYFQARNIRFIAVNENYDTAAPDDAHAGILIPLRNMINEAYSLDIARKVKAAQRQMMKDGKFVGGRAPYGYRKAPENCHKLIIDPEAAEVVRQIYEWIHDGAGLNTVVVRLNKAGILPPSYYKQAQGDITHEKLLGNGRWQTQTLAKILHDEVYAGDMVQGHTKTVDHRQIEADADNLIAVHGTHEAIVSRDLFDEVQRILAAAAQASKAKATSPYTPNLLKGKVYCACCGGHLHRQRKKRKRLRDLYYLHCLTKSRVDPDACDGVLIREDIVLDSISDTMLEHLDTALGKYALAMPVPAGQATEQTDIKNKITARNQKLTRINGLNRTLYENLTLGVITKDEYFKLRERYETQTAQLEAELQQLHEGLDALEKQLRKYQSLRRDAQSIRKDKTLTMELIDRLVERVDITPDKQISVRFTFQSEFDDYGEVMARCRAM